MRLNFWLFRHIAAFCVLFSHSFDLSQKLPLDLLRAFPFLVGTATFGVTVFFIISGYLVTQSWMRNKNSLHFLASRLLRIIPGLWACIAFVVLLGAVFSTLPVREFWLHPQVHSYIGRNVLFQNILTLPGVFEKNPLGGLVSGTFWTLPIELTCYLWVLVIGSLRGFRNPLVFALMVLLSLGAVTLQGTQFNIFQATVASDSLPLYYTAFLCGSALYGIHHFVGKYTIVPWIVPASLLITIYIFNASDVIYVAALAWFLINTVHHVSRFWPEPSRWPDLSYGIYLFGFPIQQAFIATFPHWSGWGNLAASLLLTALVASMSWYWIESPALSWKKRLREIR